MTAPLEGVPAPVQLVLHRLLPTTAETLLLNTALDGDNGDQTWSTWRAGHDLKETLASEQVGLKGLLPLLAYALEQNGVTVTANDLSLLRMARYRESLRYERYQAILQQALAALAEGGVKAILLKGAALALTAYPQPGLRHCHDIDLLIHTDDLPHATRMLRSHGFDKAPPQEIPAGGRDDLRLDHTSGLPLLLHSALLRNELFTMCEDGVWKCALPLAGVRPTLMLAPEWELVHIIGVMLCTPRRARVTWVCDAHYVIAAHPALDWERVSEIAVESALALPAFVMLHYLQQKHRAPIPAFVFAHLQQNFAAGRASYEQILRCARVQNAAGYGELLASAASWQERAFVWRWMLFPLPTTIQRSEMQGWQLPYFYLRRCVRYLKRQVIPTNPAGDQIQSRQV